MLLVLLSLSLPAAANDLTGLGWRAGVGGTVTLVYLTNLFQSDVAGVEVGQGEDVYFTRGYFRWDGRQAALGRAGGVSVDLIWQFAYAHWQSQLSDAGADGNNVISFAPVFRINLPWRWTPDFVETWVGLSLFSATEINDKRFGGHFQFEDVLATGWKLGPRDQWELSLRVMHNSNNGIYRDNNGIDFLLLGLGYRY